MKKKTLLESLQCGLLAKPTKKIDQIHFKWRKQTRKKLNSKWKIMQKTRSAICEWPFISI